MQILHWLFRATQDQTRDNSSNNKETDPLTDQEENPVKLVLLKNHKDQVQGIRLWGCKNLRQFGFLCRKDIAKSSFYSTLNLKRLKSLNKSQHWRIYKSNMKKEAIARGLGISHKQDSPSASHSGNKVLPISETAITSSSTSSSDQCGASEKKDKLKGDKTKTMSRMKELLKWAANAKSEKGGKFMGRKVLRFRNRGTLKTIPDDDQLSTESPKISFRWDMESCSTTSSVYSAISKVSSLRNDQTVNIPSVNSTPLHETDPCSTRKGNWITTDSEFVVLEL